MASSTAEKKERTNAQENATPATGRPFLLDPLFQRVTTLDGIGPRNAAFFEKLCGDKILDVLFHKPIDVVDRRFAPDVKVRQTAKLQPSPSPLTNIFPALNPASLTA